MAANLNTFRGKEPDSGTCFEIGYAYALGKKIYGYLEDDRTMLEKMGAAADENGFAVEDFRPSGKSDAGLYGCHCKRWAGGLPEGDTEKGRERLMAHLLEVKDVTKIYEGGVLANHNVNFTVDEGEIHALVGENGAGKSTLMKMLYGLESITSGHIYMNGEELKLSSSKDAIAHGIGMVHQHFMLVDSLTGAENMMMGMEKTSFRF